MRISYLPLASFAAILILVFADSVAANIFKDSKAFPCASCVDQIKQVETIL